MNKKGLDEMQVQIRDRIGNQTLLLLIYALLIDTGLYGFGFRWVSYPANIMIIVSVVSGIYVTRLISANAYVGPSSKKERPVLKVLFNVGLAVIVSAVILILVKNASFSDAGQINEMAAPILFITAGIAIVIPIVRMILNRIQNEDDGE
ncbi:MAG TPA: hypothetical protein PLD22_05085 [Bacillota bacterium]|nr:hypothetical protein [Bacillota bacterium]HQC82684.1 hypothetical protein [Bacillota bacterium]